MARHRNPVEQILEQDQAKVRDSGALGVIATVVSQYTVRESARLLGVLLAMGYDEMQVVTCDAWKRKCGGVPKNSSHFPHIWR